MVFVIDKDVNEVLEIVARPFNRSGNSTFNFRCLSRSFFRLLSDRFGLRNQLRQCFNTFISRFQRLNSLTHAIFKSSKITGTVV